jgi:ADP-ribose pyrophosphatase YjhB (NUDIX family)
MSPPDEIQGALRRLGRRGVRRWGSGRAVVAVTVVTVGGGPAVLLTRYAGSLGGHSAEFALPGGRTDRWESASSAGRRRLTEEFGMRLPPESVLGLLDDYVTDTRFVITPVVLWGGEHDPAVGVLVVPFADLDVEPVFVASSESDRPVIRLPMHGGWLHAPTAAVLHQFREVVLLRRRTRVAAC